jgi:ABC-type nitrate/sulfonate/bicarbonate transport system permease component
MIPKWLFAIRGRVPSRVALPLAMVPILVALVLWWSLTRGIPEERVISYNILPSPLEVIQSVPELLTRRELLLNLETSLKRVGIAFLLAIGITVPLGVLMGSFGSFRAMFSPTTTASGYIPIATLLPLSMSWFGTGELQKVFFLAMAFGIYLLPMVIGAIDAVPEVYLKTASTLGASRLDQVFRVLIPVALPGIWQGMRQAFGVGWTYLVLAEAVVMDGGLGTLIVISQRRGPREHIYLVIILITLVAWVTDIVWVQLGYLLFPYRRPR